MGQGVAVYKNLASINELPAIEAEAAFLDCCGSRRWARRMAEARPFRMVEEVFENAESIWFSLSAADRLEAFAAHPRIGSTGPTAKQKKQAVEWSSGEQALVKTAGGHVRKQIGEVNRLYEDKFGFIFIVCATGKTADEMLAIARARLGNSAETELRIAADEQRKITEIRLTKLLER